MYSFKDYKKESLAIRDYIHNRNSKAVSILDVACGTGRHMEYLANDYSIDGLDLNENFVRIAKDRNPGSNIWQGDMVSFQLNRKYDIVMCLFSSIAYAKTLEQVGCTIEQFKNHLNERGMIIIEPWFQPAEWSQGYISILNSETPDFKVTRMSHADRCENISILNFEYLLGSSAGITHFTESHELGLFTQKDLTGVFRDHDLQVEYDEIGISGRGTYILSKRG